MFIWQVSRGRANEYLTEVKPVVELNPAKGIIS